MVSEIIKKGFILGIVALLVVLSIFIIKPFVSSVLLAFVLAYIFYPVYKRFKRVTKSPGLTAAFVCFVVIAIIALLLWALVPTIIRQTYAFYGTIQKIDIITPLKKIFPSFFASEEFVRDISVLTSQAVSKAMSSIMDIFGKTIADLPFTLMQLTVTFFVFFFSLRDGEKITSYLKKFSPFKEEAEKKFIDGFNNITKSVVYGMFLVGIVEGALLFLGLYIFHASNMLFLTLMGTFFAMLPLTGIGSWVVWLPTGIRMIFAKNNMGIYLLIYGVCILSWVDPAIRPYVVKRKAGISHGVALIGMLGGYLLFGVVGFVVGPLVLGYLILFFEFYKAEKLHEIFK